MRTLTKMITGTFSMFTGKIPNRKLDRFPLKLDLKIITTFPNGDI